MCTIICTVRSVLWYITSIAGTLLILLALFSNKWLVGHVSPTSFNDIGSIINAASDVVTNVQDGAKNAEDLLRNEVGLFKDCVQMDNGKLFEGECIPDWEKLHELYTDMDSDKYPHSWRGAVICFVIGLGLMVITDLFALLTVCCRSCICCSVFTICGSFQSFAGILFTLGLIAYPAGWGSKIVQDEYCNGKSMPFVLGDCEIGIAFWLAVAGTVCTVLASSLAIWAYQSTQSFKCEEAKDQGEHCICLV